MERETTGRLTELPNKPGDAMAQAVPGSRAQRVQEFRTKMPWDEEDLNRQRVAKLLAEATRGDGVLVCNDTGVPKPGSASVGVARQESGTLGKGGNCQVAVTCGDTDPQATWPVAVRLYVPQTWAAEPERRQQARVPPEVAFQPKPEMALAWLDQARAWGVPPRGVVAAANDGDHPNVLAGLAARQEPSVVAVRTAFPVSMGPMASTPVWRADGRLQRVPRGPWRTVRWRRGANGWRRQTLVAVWGWRVTRDGRRHEGWLVGERASRGPPAERKSGWSHLPLDTSLAALAGLAPRRQASEPCHAAATGALGWDQDQGRLWPGFHRQAVTVMLADSVLGWLARQQRRRAKRQGRRGDPFSPSATAPAHAPCRRAW